MKKIPTIFKRNPERMQEILNEQHPDCAWVFADLPEDEQEKYRI